MKTVNGKNKLERQINTAKKWLGIELVQCSNKYLKVKSVLENNNVYLTALYGTKTRYSANKELWIIIPDNLSPDEKPIFVKNYRALRINNWYHQDMLLINSNDPRLKILSQGFDDVIDLKEHLKNNRTIYIEKR